MGLIYTWNSRQFVYMTYHNSILIGLIKRTYRADSSFLTTPSLSSPKIANFLPIIIPVSLEQLVIYHKYMETKNQLAPPVIRTAMRMSRRTIKVPKSTEASPYQSLSAFLPPARTLSGNELLQPLVSPQSGHDARPLQKHPLLEAISKSPYLKPAIKRKQQWGQFRDTNPERLYANWETDECELDDPARSINRRDSGITKSAYSLNKRKSLFRPQPIKLGKSTPASHIPQPTITSPKARSYSIPSPLWKSFQPVELPPLPGTLSANTSPSTRKALEIVIQPCVRLTAIDSEELDDSPAQIEPVLEKIREKKSNKPVPKPQQADLQMLRSFETSLKTRYSEETAIVLGNTSSLARRRSEQMTVPARLLRHAFVHD